MSKEARFWAVIGAVIAAVGLWVALEQTGLIAPRKDRLSERPPVSTAPAKQTKPRPSVRTSSQPKPPATTVQPGETQRPPRPRRRVLNQDVSPVAGTWYYMGRRVSMGGQLHEGWGSTGSSGNSLTGFATFDIRGWSRFTAYVGVDDNHPSSLFVRAAIELDGQPVWEERVEKGQVPVEVDIPLAGHRTMTVRSLEVGTTDGLLVVMPSYSDHLIMAEPTLSQ